MINFNSLDSDFCLNYQAKRRQWLSSVILHEAKITGDINYIFCNDEYLARINLKFLRHDTLTDIITFPNSGSDAIVSGDIYISLDRVKENAENLNLSFEVELDRVLVHGILHLIGYNDLSPDEKLQMRAKEDYYLHLQP